MKIIIHEVDRCGLTAFADANDLVMEIHERVPSDMGARWTENDRYYAKLKGSNVKVPGGISSEFGNGATPEEAMWDYARSISGKLLVVDAWLNSRREIKVPFLTNE